MLSNNSGIDSFETDEKAILKEVNLLVATQNNAAAICMSVEKAARGLIKKGKVDDGLLNMVEMAFRAYDPCLACATHAFNGGPALELTVRDARGDVVKTIDNFR